MVITTYNHAHFLAEAIESVLAQVEKPLEILVVDDGSTDDPASIVARYPEVRLIRQTNQGLAAARNAGLAAVKTDKVLFLDADDRLLPGAVASGIDCFEGAPDAGFVYGGHRVIDAAGRPTGRDVYAPVGLEAYRDLLKGNAIGMHATVLYDRRKLIAAGGFDRTLPRCEDYDVYFRMSRVHPVASHPDTVAEYRWHGTNMSSDHREMLHWVLLVHGRQEEQARQRKETAEDWRRGRRVWQNYYVRELLDDARRDWPTHRSTARAIRAMRSALGTSPVFTVLWLIGTLRRGLTRVLPPWLSRRLGRILGRYKPPVGAVDFGDFDRVMPLSADFGFDRGTPIDRYYIERFLERHKSDIRGRSLEIGDDSYCRRFGGDRITHQDVLHVSSRASGATIVGDLAQPGVLPGETFDCLVVTQTLHLIFDMPVAIREMHRSLKRGGVLLLTVPGISQIDRREWGESWFWSLTPKSALRLFSDVFGAENVEVEQFGNVFAAAGFLQGLAVEEVDTSKLDVVDASYPVTVAVRARRSIEP